MTRRLIRNAAKCLACGDIIESKHRHDFRVCKCGNVAVDGGINDYIRRCVIDQTKYEDRCEWDEDVKPKSTHPG